jgi:ADP-ribose pyrophosphatase YjhB (NUDIX family)
MSAQALLWLLVEQDGAVLLCRRKADQPPFAGQWTLPGDEQGADESAATTIARFAHEQLDLWLMGSEPVETLQLRDGDADCSGAVFRVGFEGKPRFRESGPYAEVGWARPDDLPSPMPAELSAWLRAGAGARPESGAAAAQQPESEA